MTLAFGRHLLANLQANLLARKGGNRSGKRAA
jgi:hypothetical protein